MSDPFKDMVQRLAKPGVMICNSLTPFNAHMWHMATGISGEAGELLDAIKKVAIYNKPIDRQNVIEELGDLEFYMEGIRQALSIPREDVIAANMHKLANKNTGRYVNGVYSDEAAQQRADKQPFTLNTPADSPFKDPNPGGD